MQILTPQKLNSSLPFSLILVLVNPLDHFVQEPFNGGRLHRFDLEGVRRMIGQVPAKIVYLNFFKIIFYLCRERKLRSSANARHLTKSGSEGTPKLGSKSCLAYEFIKKVMV